MNMFLLADWWEGLMPLLIGIFFVVRAFLEAKQEDKAKQEAKPVRPAKQTQPGPIAKGPFQDPFEDPVRGGQKPKAPFAAETDADSGEFPDQRHTRRAGEAGGAKQAKAGDAGQESIRSEVDEFLRRLAQPASEETSTKREAKGSRVRKTRQQRSLKSQSQGRSDGASEKTALDGRKRGETVEEHVRSHLGHLEESQLAENAALMGSKIAQSDDRLQARLHEKFDHRLGKLEGAKKAAAAEVAEMPAEFPSTAEAIAQMLSTPDGMRNAVVLNEILQRPIDRW